MTSSDPTLSADEQAEYERLEALEREKSEETQADADERAANGELTEHPGVDWANESGTVTEDDSALREAFPRNEDAEKRFPVEHGAVVDTEATRTYDTPWGRREMTEHEVADLAHQNVVCTPVDAAAETSLQREKDDMSGVVFAPKP